MHGRVDAPHSNRRDFENLKKLTYYLWDYKGRVLAALACLMASKLTIVAVPLLLKEIVNALDQTGSIAGTTQNAIPDATSDATPDAIESTTEAIGSAGAHTGSIFDAFNGHDVMLVGLGLVAAYGLLRLASSAFKELRDSLFARVRYRAMHKLSTEVLTHLHNLSLSFHLDRHTGSISKDLSRGTNSLSSIVNLLIFNIVPTAAEFLLVAGILFSGYGWEYTLVVIGTVVIYIAFTLFFSGWRMQFRHEMNRLDSLSNGRAVDSLLNFETVKYFNNEPREISAYDEHMKGWGDAGVRSQVTMSTLNFGQAAIVSVGVTLIMLLATRDVASNVITLGDIVLINALMLQLFVPLNVLGVVYRGLQYALADMDLVLKLLETEPEIQDRPKAVDLQVKEARIEFDNVHFAYLLERPILKGLSFVVEPGTKVAVVGPSGAGKSTLSRLLFRFYDVDEGQVRIDGVDVRDCTQQSLREALGVVPQDTVMFNDTIRYKRRLCRPGC